MVGRSRDGFLVHSTICVVSPHLTLDSVPRNSSGARAFSVDVFSLRVEVFFPMLADRLT
jgi:hypothetical protein